MTTNYRRCYAFLNACYHNDGFRIRRECLSVLNMMKRHKKIYGVINDFMALDLNDMIESAKKLLNHPERASSEPKLCGILEDMERVFAR